MKEKIIEVLENGFSNELKAKEIILLFNKRLNDNMDKVVRKEITIYDLTKELFIDF